MEPLTMFAITVGFIGALHLISTTADRLGKGKQNRTQATRDDWYCFFKTSDLLGTDAAETSSQQPTVTNDKQLDQRRRQQANRPRLQV